MLKGGSGKTGNADDEVQNAAAAKIQAVHRGKQVRKGVHHPWAQAFHDALHHTDGHSPKHAVDSELSKHMSDLHKETQVHQSTSDKIQHKANQIFEGLGKIVHKLSQVDQDTESIGEQLTKSDIKTLLGVFAYTAILDKIPGGKDFVSVVFNVLANKHAIEMEVRREAAADKRKMECEDRANERHSELLRALALLKYKDIDKDINKIKITNFMERAKGMTEGGGGTPRTKNKKSQRTKKRKNTKRKNTKRKKTYKTYKTKKKKTKRLKKEKKNFK